MSNQDGLTIDKLEEARQSKRKCLLSLIKANPRIKSGISLFFIAVLRRASFNRGVLYFYLQSIAKLCNRPCVLHSIEVVAHIGMKVVILFA